MNKETRGTEVVLHLRPEEDELLAGFKLREILRKYSDHITVPILMKKEQWDSTAKAQVLTDEDEQINQASALWARPKSEITEEQYHEFYKHVGHDFEPPLAYVHARVEGRQEYTLLLYLPRQAPFDLWNREHRRGIKLYVRRVFIMDDAEQLMPPYLRFVRGVIDSNDLPLNVSREILQQSRDVEAIRTTSVKRVLGLLEDLAGKEADKFATFWKEFGRVLKEGVVEDSANRDRIAKLLRFSSTRQRDRGADRLARRLRGADEGEADRDLLHHRRRLRRRAEQPAPRDLPEARRRGAAAARPHRRVGRVVAHRVRRQAAAVDREGRPRPERARRRGGEERRGTTAPRSTKGSSSGCRRR